MASLLLAVLLLAAAGPEAPVAPVAPVVVAPSGSADAALLPGRRNGATATPTATPTAMPTAMPTTTTTAMPTATPAATTTATPTAIVTRHSAPNAAAKHGARTRAQDAGAHVARKEPAEPLLELSAPPRPAVADPPTLPPALTGTALRDELRASSQKRQEELASLARERAHLEKLAADVAAARAALRDETARLDARVKAATEKAAAAGGASAGARPGGPVRPEADGQALAKTLKSMKPEQAAALLAHLDRPLAVGLLRRMRPGDAAAVLEKLKPEAAAELFSNMAGGTK